jgi:plasmid maintenance system killer protein
MYRNLGEKANNLNEQIRLYFGDAHLKQAYQHRGILKLFLTNLKLQMQRQLKQNLDISEAYFLISFAEARLLDFAESKTNKLPHNLKEGEIFHPMDAVDFQNAFLNNPQLVILGRKNRSQEKSEEVYIDKISKLLNEISISKLESLELLDFYGEKISSLKEELTWELKKQARGLHFLSPKETKEILANGFNEPVLYYKNKSNSTQWSVEEFRFTKNEEGQFVIDRNALTRRIESLSAEQIPMFIPFWYFPKQRSKNIKVAHFPFAEKKLSDQFYRDNMSLQLYYLHQVIISKTGKIEAIEILSSKDLDQFRHIRVEMGLLANYLERVKNAENPELNYQLINDAPTLKNPHAKDLVEKAPIESKLPKDIPKEPNTQVSTPAEKSAESIRLTKRQRREQRKLHKQQERSEKNKQLAESVEIKEDQSDKKQHDIFDLIHLVDNKFHGGKIPRDVKKAYNTFTRAITKHGYLQVKEIPGYHHERLNGHHSIFSVRLNKSFRLYFVKAKQNGKEFLLNLHIGNHDYDSILGSLEQRLDHLKNEYEIL